MALAQISVLHVFRSLCQDPRGMLELFINYDMASDRIDLFQRILAALASIAQGSTSDDFNASQKSPGETADLRFLAMQGVVTLTKSLSSIVDGAAGPQGSQEEGDAGEEGTQDEQGAGGAGGGAALSTPQREGDEEAAAGTPSDAGGTGSAPGGSLSLVESYDLRVGAGSMFCFTLCCHEDRAVSFSFRVCGLFELDSVGSLPLGERFVCVLAFCRPLFPCFLAAETSKGGSASGRYSVQIQAS